MTDQEIAFWKRILLLVLAIVIVVKAGIWINKEVHYRKMISLIDHKQYDAARHMSASYPLEQQTVKGPKYYRDCNLMYDYIGALEDYEEGRECEEAGNESRAIDCYASTYKKLKQIDDKYPLYGWHYKKEIKLMIADLQDEYEIYEEEMKKIMEEQEREKKKEEMWKKLQEEREQKEREAEWRQIHKYSSTTSSKKSSKDYYRVDEYDNPHDFADDVYEEFYDFEDDFDDEDDAWDAAYEYWEDHH